MLYRQILRTNTIWPDSPQSSVRLIHDFKEADRISVQDSDVFNAQAVIGYVSKSISEIGFTQEEIDELRAILNQTDNLVTQSELNKVIASIPSIQGLATYAQLVEVQKSIPSTADFVTNATIDGLFKTQQLTIENWANSRFALQTSLDEANAKLSNLNDWRKLQSEEILLINGKLVGISTTVKSYVDDAIEDAINNLDFTIFLPVTELPTTGRTNKIYLVAHKTETATDTNRWQEWIWTQKPGSTEYAWESIGSITLDIDLDTLATIDWTKTLVTTADNANRAYTIALVNTTDEKNKTWTEALVETTSESLLSYADNTFLNKTTGGTVAGPVTIQGNVNATNGVFSGSATIAGALTAAGATKLSNGLEVTGVSRFNDEILLPISGGGLSSIDTIGTNYSLLRRSANSIYVGSPEATVNLQGAFATLMHEGERYILLHSGNYTQYIDNTKLEERITTNYTTAINNSDASNRTWTTNLVSTTDSANREYTEDLVSQINTIIRQDLGAYISSTDTANRTWTTSQITAADTDNRAFTTNLVNSTDTTNKAWTATLVESTRDNLKEWATGQINADNAIQAQEIKNWADQNFLKLTGGTVAQLTVSGAASVNTLSIGGKTAATQDYVDSAIANVNLDLFVIVSELPATGLSNKIYLLPSDKPTEGNLFLEYIWVNGKWELIGSVSIDLTGIATESWVLDKNYVDATKLSSSLSSKANNDTTISAGSGLTGGGDLSANRTLSLGTVGAAGTYTKVTTDIYGRVTAGTTLSTSDIPDLSSTYATVGSLSTGLASKVDNTISISAGTGLSGGGTLAASRTISLAAVGSAGTYTKVTTDAYGRVTAGTTLAAADIPSLSATYLSLASGGTVVGAVVFSADVTVNGGLYTNAGIRLKNDYSVSANNSAGAGFDLIFMASTNVVTVGNNTYATRFRSGNYDLTHERSGSVYSILTSNNYNYYSPGLLGAGASGTWNISISGNAATVTNGLTTSNYGSYALSLSGGRLTGVASFGSDSIFEQNTVLFNNRYHHVQSTSGGNVGVLGMSGNNEVVVGNGGFKLYLAGSSATYNGNTIYHSGNANSVNQNWTAQNLQLEYTGALYAKNSVGVFHPLIFNNTSNQTMVGNATYGTIIQSNTTVNGMIHVTGLIQTANCMLIDGRTANEEAAIRIINRSSRRQWGIRSGYYANNELDFTITDESDTNTPAFAIDAGSNNTVRFPRPGGLSSNGPIVGNSSLTIAGTITMAGATVATQSYVDNLISSINTLLKTVGGL